MNDNKKILVIFNGASGKSAIKAELWQVVDILVKGGYDVTVYPTQKRFDAHDVIIKRADEFDVIAVCGGDGTLSEAVQGMVELPKKDRVPIGYIPCGSTNDFGASLEIPFEIPEAAQKIVTGKAISCDCGKFNDKPYLYISAFGMFTDVSYETPQKMKNQLGHAAYIMEAIRRFKDYSYYHMKVESEEFVTEDDFILGLVCVKIVGMKKRIAVCILAFLVVLPGCSFGKGGSNTPSDAGSVAASNVAGELFHVVDTESFALLPCRAADALAERDTGTCYGPLKGAED